MRADFDELSSKALIHSINYQRPPERNLRGLLPLDGQKRGKNATLAEGKKNVNKSRRLLPV